MLLLLLNVFALVIYVWLKMCIVKSVEDSDCRDSNFKIKSLVTKTNVKVLSVSDEKF